MIGMLSTNLLNLDWYLANPWLIVPLAFQLWMLIDAIRRQEYFWAAFIFFFPLLNAILYFFLVYRAQPGATRGFELPGAGHRKRIKELEAQIHHLDKAHHHAELGDIYFQQGKLDQAEQCYRAALERDPADPDFKAHLGQCLLRKDKPQEALTLLAEVAEADSRHDYGHTLMACAEARQALGQTDEALACWRKVLEDHNYARAKVQLAEALIKKGDKTSACRELNEVIADDAHAAAFQRKKDRPWLRRAKALLKECPPA